MILVQQHVLGFPSALHALYSIVCMYAGCACRTRSGIALSNQLGIAALRRNTAVWYFVATEVVSLY